MDDEYERVRVDRPGDGIERVTLAHPERRNAQDQQMLYELDAALTASGRDDAVRVVVIAADGDDFSSGHDLAASWMPGTHGQPVTQHGGWDAPGQEGFMAIESEVFFGLCWRWRNFPKPTIVQVQGRVIAGGLMLVWPFDIVVASDDASFSDPVTAFGVNGIEFFAHPWELGARRAKELLFTGDPIGASEAQAAGMVNRVVSRAELERTTLELAARIAARPAFGVRLAKQSVNQTQDAQGFWTAVQAAFALHQVTHAHNQLLHGSGIDLAGVELIRAGARRPAQDA